MSKSVYNKIVRVAPGTNGVSSFNGRVADIVPATNDYQIGQIGGVSINNPVNGQILSYNGTNFINSTPSDVITSVFSRTGDILATEGDYNIDQMGDVAITGAVADDVLTFNGVDWINKKNYAYKAQQLITALSLNAEIDTIYTTLSNPQVALPTLTADDIGKRICFIGGSFVINFSALQTLETDTYGPFAVSSSGGVLELQYNNNGDWLVANCTSNFANPTTGKPYAKKNLQDLNNIAISTPLVGQNLQWNGSNWANATQTYPADAISSVFGRTGVITSATNDYAISQIQNASFLANSANVDPALANYFNFHLYNTGSYWSQRASVFYTDIVSNSNTSFTAELQKIYNAPGCTITMPYTGSSDFGKRILFSTSQGSTMTIVFPALVYLAQGNAQNFSIHSSYGSIELINVSANVWSIVSCSSEQFLDSVDSKPFTPRKLESQTDVNISVNLAEGDILQYESGKWVDAPSLWDDLRVPITSTTRQGSNDPTFSRILNNGAGSQGVFCYFFNSTQQEELYFEAQLPHAYKEGTELRPHVHFVPTTNNAGTIRWGLEYTFCNPFEVFGNTSIIYGEYAIPANSIHAHLIKGFTLNSVGGAITGIDGTGKKVSAMLICRVFRDSTHPNDTYNSDAGLIEIDFHYMKHGNGSRDEYIK